MANTLFPIKIKKKARKYERPESAKDMYIVSWKNLSAMLPTDAYLHGCILRDLELNYNRDPVVLYDNNGKILHEWGYIPSLSEVFETCHELG